MHLRQVRPGPFDGGKAPSSCIGGVGKSKHDVEPSIGLMNCSSQDEHLEQNRYVRHGDQGPRLSLHHSIGHITKARMWRLTTRGAQMLTLKC
jgi:hypothetical protein